jgi:hypothetical protein
MIRVLVMIAVMGFVLSVATLTAAFAIGGPEVIARGGWNLADGHWGHSWNWDDDGDWSADDRGAQATRDFAWNGGDSLDIDVPANVHYTQAPGPGSVKVSGSAWAVNHLVVNDGHITFDRGRHHRHGRTLEITIQAPGVTDFDLSGRSRLEIANYRQPRLKVDISGSGHVEATGQADVVDIDISGSGEADLSALKSKGAEVDISGSGDATISPSEWARLEISGRGDVSLTTNPPRVETDVSGSGEVHRISPLDDESASPSPSPSPSPTPSPPPTPRKKT